MTIEEEFFKTFGIEKREYETPSREYDDDGEICSYYVEEEYPEITDRVLLELICILNSIYDCGVKNNTSLSSKKVEFLKMEVLNYCILHKQQIKNQVQALFEGDNENPKD